MNANEKQAPPERVLRRIVVPLDGSEMAEAAVGHATALARSFGASVDLIRVVQPGRAGGVTHDAVEWRLDRSHARRYLERVAGRLRDAGVSVDTAVLEGLPAEQIVGYGRGRNADLLVLTTHGQSKSTDFLLGGTVEKVVSGAGISVMLVRPGRVDSDEAVRYRRILVPVDGSKRADWAGCVAATVARAQGAELGLVQVVPVPEMPRRTPLDEEARELKARVVGSNRRAGERYLKEMKDRLTSEGLAVETRLLVDAQVSEALHRVADRTGADLVVVCAHGASGPAPWPYGSVVTNLIHYGEPPLLILQDQPCREPLSAAGEAEDEAIRRTGATTPPVPGATGRASERESGVF